MKLLLALLALCLISCAAPAPKEYAKAPKLPPKPLTEKGGSDNP